MRVDGKKVEKWKKTSFMINEKLWDYAKIYAKENGTSVSYLINEYLTELIKENAPHLLSPVPHKDQMKLFETE